MRTASPKRSSLPILALLLLLAHGTPPAQGRPLLTTYITLISEMMELLNRQPMLSKGDLELDDKFILRNTTFLKTNLEEFLNAAENFKDKAESIGKILKAFQEVVPATPSVEDSISIDKNDWDDFRRKLKEYLDSLLKFVTAKNFNPTTRSSSGPS